MADQLAPVALHALRMTGENYETLANTGQKGMEKIRRRRTKRNGDQEEYYYSRNTNTRAKSAGDYYDRDSRGRDSTRNRRGTNYDDYDDYESEASIPPRNRRRDTSSQSQSQSRTTPQNGAVVSTRGGGGGGRSRGGSSSDSSTSSSSSEDLGSSTDDEKQEKKIRRGELITGGLAAVASVHAAGTVWGSMEARDAREEAVANGTLTKEEAKRERRKNQFQDVAALGLAALAIKGAYGKWKGTAAQHKTKKEHKQRKEERHAKRVEKGVDRESRRYGGSIQGGAQKKAITDGRDGEKRQSRPSYNRAFSHSENDLTGGGYGGRGYEDYGRGGYGRDDYYDRYDNRGRGGYSGYSRDV